MKFFLAMQKHLKKMLLVTYTMVGVSQIFYLASKEDMELRQTLYDFEKNLIGYL